MRTTTSISRTAPVKRILAATFPEYRGRKIRLSVSDRPLDVRSCWDGGSRSYFTFVRLDTFVVMEMPAQSAFDKRVTGADAVTLPPGCACVEHIYFCGKDLGITIHVGTDASHLIEKGGE